MTKFHELRIDDYLKNLASRNPVPGGGSAAALSGAMGVALILKALVFTSGSRGQEKQSLLLYGRKLNVCLSRLIKAVSDDSAAYLEVSRAMKLPRNNRRQRDTRIRRLSRALRLCASVSRRVELSVGEAAGICDKIKSSLNKNFTSDIFAARKLLKSSADSSRRFYDENINYLRRLLRNNGNK